MLNHKMLKQLQDDLKQQETGVNRRLSVLLHRYRTRGSELWCPRCWLIRCTLLAVALVLVSVWLWG